MVPHFSDAKSFSAAALVLAAGAGRRFGGGKMLAPWQGGRLIDGALRAALAAPVETVVVVTGAEAEAVAAHVRAFADDPRVRILHAPDWDEGMSASLKAAALAMPEADALVVFLGDMPRVPPDLTGALLAAVKAGAPAAAPVCRGQRGHPAVLGREVLAEVPGLSGDRGAGPLLAGLGARLALIETNDEGVLFDVDERP